MPILKDHAQVLHVYEQSNTSQIAVMFGRRLGQFRMLAKGVRRWYRKGFEGGLDLLARGEILVYPRPGENLWIFKEWNEDARPDLGQSPALLNAASYLCELTEALTRHTSGSVHETGVDAGDEAARTKLYELLAASADALAAGAEPGARLSAFTLKALDLEGLLPPLDVCGDCDRPFFDTSQLPRRAWLSASGLACNECLAGSTSPSPRLPAPPSPRRAVQERGIWLQPEAHKALLHMQATSRTVTLSVRAAKQLALSLTLLVHGALERDLRTLPKLAGIMVGAFQ